MHQSFFINMGDFDGGDPPDRPSKPKAPIITCFCCGNSPKKLDTWDWYDKYVFVGQCCGRDFNVSLSHELINDKGVKTYVVNMG